MELPLLGVLSRMERRGVLIDSDALFLQSNEIANRLSELEEQAYVLAGQPFNLASTKQLQEILFDKLGLPVIQKTPKGAPSTNEEVLEELAFSHELPKVLVEHRGLSKTKIHLHRQITANGESANGSSAYFLPSSGDRHRSSFIKRSESAKHSDS